MTQPKQPPPRWSATYAMLAEAHRVAVEALPIPGLAAYAAVEQVSDAAGGRRDRVDRRGQLRYDKVWIRLPTPAPAIIGSLDLAERDLRWLTSGSYLRHGRRAEALAEAAAASGLFRLLYELDMSQARTRLGRLVGIAPRPEAESAVECWLADLNAQDQRVLQRLIDTVPAAAKAWAAEEAPRLIAAAAGSVAARARMAKDLCALAERLPTDGVPLSVLADDAVHSTHGLDLSTSLGRLGSRLAAVIAGLAQPTSTAEMREAWEAVGVWVDRISSQIAGWNLPIHPAHPAAAVAAAYNLAGQPAVLTLGLISSTRAPLVAPPPDDRTLWVVEGISTLAAAAAKPVPGSVVCRGGTPSVAVTQLIRAAANVGWKIAVSSDFEPRGLHGAIMLLRHLEVAGRPWRLTAADYLAAPAEGEPFTPDQVPDTPWDLALADAMRQRRERVSEEARLATLIADLQRRSTSPL